MPVGLGSFTGMAVVHVVVTVVRDMVWDREAEGSNVVVKTYELWFMLLKNFSIRSLKLCCAATEEDPCLEEER
jgi:hypothetical protein